MRPADPRRAVLIGLLLAGPLTAAPTAWPTSRTLTYAELALLSREPLKITAPVLRLVTGAPSGPGRSWVANGRVWADYGQGWREVARTNALWPDVPQDRPGEMLILLEGAPQRVRVGITGCVTSVFLVDHLELILPDGRRLAPTAVSPLAHVDNPQRGLGEDGQVAAIIHTAPAQCDLPVPVAGLDYRFEVPPGDWRQVRPTVPIRRARFGVYYNPGVDGDPNETTAGYTWRCNPVDAAFYDFTMPQWNEPALNQQIQRLNPQHRVLARLMWPTTNPLDYYYLDAERAKVAAAVREQLGRGTGRLEGVFLGDEEPQWYFAGWHADTPPDWALRHRARFEAETGQQFDWRSPAVRTWVIERGKRLWDDLYALVKAADPKLKVLPFCYVPEDPSGWGMWEPATIKADGWVCQWADDTRQCSLAVPCAHADPRIRSVWVREHWFPRSVAKLRQAGVALDDLYCNIWAYRPIDDPIAQIEQARLAGVTNFFTFYCAGWFPDPPPDGPSPRDAAFALTAAGEAAPCLTQQTGDTETAVGPGLAQSFVALKDSLAAVSLRLVSERDNDDYTVAIAPDGADGLPAATMLVSTPLHVPAGTRGWVTVPLSCRLQVGRRYHLVLRAKDTRQPGLPVGNRPLIEPHAGLRLTVSLADPYAGGELVSFEDHGGGYANWRPPHGGYRTEYLQNWTAGVRLRRDLETYISYMRTIGR